MWHLIKSIDKVISELTISSDYFSYYTSDYILHFIDKESLLEINALQFDRDSNYTLKDNKLYISNDGELRIINIDTNKVLEKFDSGKQYISALPDNLYLASSYIRAEKKYENLIFNIEKEVVFEINGEFGVNDFFESFLFLYNRAKDKIAVADICAKRKLWDYKVNDIVNGTTIIKDKFLIVPLTQSILKVEIETGNILWRKNIVLSFFKINEQKSKIYSLSENTFDIINVESGEREMQKELDLQVPSHLTFYAGGYLYFSGFKGDNVTRIFGAVDVNTGEIDFTQSIEMPNRETYPGTYGKPVVVGNKLYIRDQSKTLHIYERQN